VPALEHAAPSAAQAAPRLSRPFVATLMLANFGTNVALIAPIQNILPRMVEAAAGSADKALGLGLVTGLGALAALVVNPLAGHYSDRWVSADNRVVMVLIGLVTGGVAHAILGFQHSIVEIAIWWTLCQATINIAYSPMSAIVVDHVDRRSWGLVWGLISVAQAVGLIVGFAEVVLVFPSVTAGMIAISVGYVVCLIPLVFVLYRLPRVSYTSRPATVPDSADADFADAVTAATGTAATGTAATTTGAGPGGPTTIEEARTQAGRTEAGTIGAGTIGAGTIGAARTEARTVGAGTVGAGTTGAPTTGAPTTGAGTTGAPTSGTDPASAPAALGGWAGIGALLSGGQGFGLVWVGKFLVVLAETIALLYLYYYLQDVVHYRDPGQGQLILVLTATIAAIIATVAVGRVADLSDGYRRYAVLSSVLMAATGFVLAGFAAWAVVIVCAFALGAGYGAFQSVSQALSNVVLPDQAHAGRDLGIINIASAVPQVIGAPIAGLVVAEAGGYRGLFVFAGILALAAAAVFTRVPS
jgi:MFS family permease